MSERPPVILRPKRRMLAVGLLVAFVFVALGWWISGVIGWASIAVGATLAAYGAYQLVTRRPGLTLTGGGVRWNEIASLHELSVRQGAAQARLLGIETLGHIRSRRSERLLFDVDVTINLTPLERPADEIFELVEAYSRLTVSRLG